MFRYAHLFVVAVAVVAAAFPISDALTERAARSSSLSLPLGVVPWRRAYNPSIQDHFYTPDLNEWNNAVNNLGYSAEGIACQIHSTQQWDTVAFYRMYNPSIYDHFYTTSEPERENAIRNLGYSDEGITGYIYPEPCEFTVPLYRLYSPSATDHFYTISEAERDNAATNLGYSKEGIAGYVFRPN
jgi:hypothetical protein